MTPSHQSTPSPTEPQDRPRVKTRRPHKKSRNGCIDCRKRRIKCSEERPSCRSCVRREISCQYTKEIHQVSSDKTLQVPDVPNVSPLSRRSPVAHSFPDCSRTLGQTTPASTPGTNFGTPQSFVAAPPNFSIRDLELLHHWIVSTSVDIYKTPGVDALWQTILPQIGFQHPFVAHAILSLAALHMSYINGSQDRSYIMEASQHHEIGVAGFHECVNNLTQEKSEALLAWSILNLLYVFSISRQLADSVERNSPRLRKDRLLGVEWIPMMRGIDAVLGPYFDFLAKGRLSTILQLGNWEELDPEEALPNAVDPALRLLRGLWENSSDAEVYEQALSAMRKCRMYTEQFQTMDTQTLQKWGCNRAWAGPMAFVHFAPQEYFTLLHQRQPHSLILFAYFGAFLHTLDDYWFLDGWGKDIVEVVDEMLGSYWRPWIHLPLQSVGLREGVNI
ncbi:hypothetical protein F5883DRAFT_536747 [Diaporthe sp. PMI_573]|nr:hypothetical protein F5883DRAFT_536747 [Diaporthaceae sp. PMI_573]